MGYTFWVLSVLAEYLVEAFTVSFEQYLSFEIVMSKQFMSSVKILSVSLNC